MFLGVAYIAVDREITMNLNGDLDRMFAVDVLAGATGDISFSSVQRPAPGPTDVLVKVRAAGVNRADVSQRVGRYPAPQGATSILGLEIAGEIVRTGDAVTRWQIGDEVCALVAGGGYAEYCIVPQGQCLPRPAHLSMAEAASLPEACATVWSMIWDEGGLSTGETLLVHGGASGIGVMATQVASQLGHRVFVTAGDDERCQACRELGAETAINYNTSDFTDAVLHATGGRGVDVIIDMVGGSYVQRGVEALSLGGRIVIISFIGGNIAEVDLRKMLLRRARLVATSIRYRSEEFKAGLIKRVESNIWPLISQKRIRPVVHQVFPIGEVDAAHKLMQSGKQIGKVVLSFD
jgi:putative PIG3 family NAD(P)H quinone oxidoreductase